MRRSETPPGNQPNPTITVIVASRNRATRLTRLLQALAVQSIGPDRFDVVVVDDCSTDDTPSVLAALADDLPFRLRPMRTATNNGPGPARNLGWRSTDATILAFTDDDCVPDPHWLAAGVGTLLADPQLGLVQGRTVAAEAIADLPERWLHRVTIDGPNPFFETCNIFYRRGALEVSGGFGEHRHWWRGWWCEDSFAGWGAMEAGWQRAFCAEATVTHDVEIRQMRWWLSTSLSQCDEIALAKRFPAYRETFWRPWSPRQQDAAFVIGTVGVIAALRWRPALAAALPYAWTRRPSVRQPHFAQRCVETVAVDAARTIGNVYGAVRSRTFVV